MGALARAAALAPDEDLSSLAATVSDVASFDTCPVTVSTRPATMNTPAWPLDRPPPGALTMPEPEVTGQLNERGVLVKAVKPVAAVVTPAAVPTPAADGTAAALREAAASLAQAAAALSAATAARDQPK